MLVTLGRYFDPWEAHVLRARLESEGIPATVTGDQHIIANWPLSVALGGAALQVPAACQSEAEAVLASYHAGELQADLVAEQPAAADACPACGAVSPKASVPLRQRLLAVATFLVASAPFPTRASRFQCASCGHAWRYGDNALTPGE